MIRVRTCRPPCRSRARSCRQVCRGRHDCRRNIRVHGSLCALPYRIHVNVFDDDSPGRTCSPRHSPFPPVCSHVQVGSWRCEDRPGPHWRLLVSESGLALEGEPEPADSADAAALAASDVPKDCALVVPFTTPCAGVHIQLHGAHTCRFTLSLLTSTMASAGAPAVTSIMLSSDGSSTTTICGCSMPE